MHPQEAVRQLENAIDASLDEEGYRTAAGYRRSSRLRARRRAHRDGLLWRLSDARGRERDRRARDRRPALHRRGRVTHETRPATAVTGSLFAAPLLCVAGDSRQHTLGDRSTHTGRHRDSHRHRRPERRRARVETGCTKRLGEALTAVPVGDKHPRAPIVVEESA